MVNTSGVPNLSVEQYRVVMNIVVLESRIDGIVKAGKSLKNNSKSLYGLEYEYKRKMEELTWGYAPKEFWERILKTQT